jgi:hypothetical protein
VTTESRERAVNFYQCEIDNHHVYDCSLCDQYHVVEDNADAFKCPYAEMAEKPSLIMFHPNE